MKTADRNVIIADSSPLIILARCELLTMLKEIFKTVYIPLQVANECLFDLSKPGAGSIKFAMKEGIIQLYQESINPIPNFEFPSILGEGETAALKLGYHLNAIVLIDDLWGRKIAKELNISTMGTAGLLLNAKRLNVIPEITSTINTMKDNGFHLSESLVKEILLLANES